MDKYPRDQPPSYETSEAQGAGASYHGGGQHYQQPQYQQQYPQQQHTVIVTGQPTVISATPIIAVGGCPACRSGVMVDNFTCLGIFLAILFFPIGILCCFLMTEKRCTHCGASFG